MTKSSLLRSDSERKFTPPTEFPAEYVDCCGKKAVVLGIAPNCSHPFIGYDFEGAACAWTERGEFTGGRFSSSFDLHDIPKRITTWHNVYVRGLVGRYDSREEADTWVGDHRLCVYRIECYPDGRNPEIFVEEV